MKKSRWMVIRYEFEVVCRRPISRKTLLTTLHVAFLLELMAPAHVIYAVTGQKLAEIKFYLHLRRSHAKVLVSLIIQPRNKQKKLFSCTPRVKLAPVNTRLIATNLNEPCVCTEPFETTKKAFFPSRIRIRSGVVGTRRTPRFSPLRSRRLLNFPPSHTVHCAHSQTPVQRRISFI